MRSVILSFLLGTVLFSQIARADEGMWLPFMLGRNYEDMKKHGLRLTPEEIYSINNSSLKDAVISFGGFCTGEIISDKGLILTNHHCGYDAIAESSSPEHNYLDNGFWAKSHKEEIPIPGLTATFIIRIQDVSNDINSQLNDDMTEDERAAKIKELTATLVKDATTGTNYEAFVRDFFEGNEFYLFVKETFKDVRMVGTPPQSAGKYGGDTDNWMWPRHTADFSMFRIYANSENKPADFSENNQPYSPKHSLPISIKGVQEGDYAMVMGFPGSTDRYLSSYGVQQAITLEQPKRVEVRAKKLQIMRFYMDKDVDVRLKYSSDYAQVANYWKYFIGQTEQVKKNGVIAKKKEVEKAFSEFTKGDSYYANVLSDMQKYYDESNKTVNIKVYQSEFIYTVGLNVSAFRYKFWIDAKNLGTEGSVRADMINTRLKSMVEEFLNKANMDIELNILSDVFKMYAADIPQEQMGEYTRSIVAKGDKGIAKFIKAVGSKSIFTDRARFEAFAAAPTVEALEKDPLYQLVADMNDAFVKATQTDEMKTLADGLDRANRRFVKGLRLMQPDKKFYPNANSTMRLTYGNVLSYSPKDAVTYNYYTTLDGMIAKEDPDNFEFNIDPRIKEVWAKKDYGQYANAKGELVVNFLSNNDITGGNSGSPVINGDGQLIGTAFDGNWEAMSGDIFFEPNIQRTISLDIRYTLWLIDKCYGATNLIEEMKLVK